MQNQVFYIGNNTWKKCLQSNIWCVTKIHMKTNKPIICASVAVGPDNVIGHNGVMPWYSKQDFYHFKTITTPYPCIFGKTTFENMPKKPLPNRLNIVCSSTYRNELKDGVFYANSIESAIDFCKDYEYVFICGGASIYKYAFEKDLIDIVYLTEIINNGLEKDVCTNTGSYCRFPKRTSDFFDDKNWVGKRIKYQPNILPKEINDTRVKFFRCMRVR